MTPQDSDHKAMWAAIEALRAELDMNGYAHILRDLARRAENRRIFWETLKKPISVLTKIGWLIFGALIWGIANHLFKFWPVGTP